MAVDVVSSNGPVLLLQVRGRINVLTADAFEVQVRRAVAASDRDVIMDASQVTYLSSAGLRVFLQIWQELSREDRTLHVCALRPYIQQVFEIVGFDQIITIQADTAAALAAAEARMQS